MNDHTALIAEARTWAGSGEMVKDIIFRLAAALEAVQQTPAVDREALAAVIHERFNIARGRGGVAPLALAEQIFASGILLDAAEVEARGLEKAAEEVSGFTGLSDIRWVSRAALITRAQQVREGN